MRHLLAEESPGALYHLRAVRLYLTGAMVVHSVPHWFPAVSLLWQTPCFTKMEV